jgi:signal transduction histidine kinase
LLHDAFVSISLASNFSTTTIQQEIDRFAALNPDLVEFMVTTRSGDSLTVLASLDAALVGSEVPYTDNYRSAAVRTDESLIHESAVADGRVWLAYRAIEPVPGSFYFIYTKTSLSSVDALFASREKTAYFSLVYIYVFMLALAYWHVRLTDYRYLYFEAKRAAEMKDLFTNMIAHELRAPLSAIAGYASMTREAEASEEVHGYAERVKDAADRLLSIVNDLLDVARIHSGKLSVTKEAVDVSSVVRAVVDELQVSALEKKLGLSAIAVDVAHDVVGDHKRLHQAITNLVSNAIKYTPDGTIELSIEEKYNKVELRVKDTGSGISFEDQQKLFAPFFRVASDDVSKITGSGLGMWITKQLIELMDGTIAVESIKGVGTHLVIQLPKQPRKSA